MLVVYQTCNGPIPEERVASTLQHLPQNTRVSFFNDSQLSEFMAPRATLHRLFNGLKHFPHKVDVWRYALLYERGGLYLDADAQIGPERLSHDLWEGSDAILVYDRHLDNIYNGFMYMRRPWNPILRRVLQRMVKRGAANGVNLLENYHYNLVYLREEVEALIGQRCKTLKRAIEHLRVPPNASGDGGEGFKLTLLTRQNGKISWVDDQKRQLILARNLSGWDGCKSPRQTTSESPSAPVQGTNTSHRRSVVATGACSQGCLYQRCFPRHQCVHSQVAELQPRASSIIFMVVVGKYVIGNVTIPRWRRYSQAHGHDFLVVTDRNKSVTGVASTAWDRVFIAQALFRKGYTDVMHVDGDTAPLAAEVDIRQYIRNSSGPFADADPDSFLYISQDVGRFGAYRPSRQNFERRISMAIDRHGVLTGPNNFGIWLMRRGQMAAAALEHLVLLSQTPSKAFQRFPAEQGVLNAWLGQNCTQRTPSAGTATTWPACVYAQAKYGTFQRFIGRFDGPSASSNSSGWDAALRKTLHSYRDAGVFALHTPGISQVPSFAMLLFRLADELFPVPAPRPS